MSVFGGTAQQRITTSIYVLCHKHFNKELKLACEGKEGAPHSLVGEYVDLLKKLDLPVVAKSAVGSIFEDRVEETKSTIVPSVLSPGCHDYSSILKNQDFNIIALMNSATVVGEGQIPARMVNMTTISRVGKANSSFKLNYVGLLVWKFMNNNNCWLLPGSLQEGKNPENVRIFNGYVAFLRQHNQELWDKVTTSHIIPSDKIKNWVSNVKHRYGTYGTFHDASDTMSGLYIGQHKLLDEIGFPFAH